MGELLERRVADLRDTITLALRDFDKLAERVRAARPQINAETGQLAVYGAAALVQGYYTHLERVFERIARDLNASPLDGPDWHRRLMRSMTLDRPGVRPPVIESEMTQNLDELLRFRHLFRNLYVLDLDPERVARLLDALIALHPAVVSALEKFSTFLSRLLASGESQ